VRRAAAAKSVAASGGTSAGVRPTRCGARRGPQNPARRPRGRRRHRPHRRCRRRRRHRRRRGPRTTAVAAWPAAATAAVAARTRPAQMPGWCPRAATFAADAAARPLPAKAHTQTSTRRRAARRSSPPPPVSASAVGRRRRGRRPPTRPTAPGRRPHGDCRQLRLRHAPTSPPAAANSLRRLRHARSRGGRERGRPRHRAGRRGRPDPNSPPRGRRPLGAPPAAAPVATR